MAEIDKKKVLREGVEIITVKDFAQKFSITPQAVHYAITKDKVDYVKLGHEALIIMTDKTRAYAPHS